MLHRMVSERVRYDIAVMARLRFPLPSPASTTGIESSEAARDAAWEERTRFADAVERAYDERLANEYLEFDEDESPPALPNVLAEELTSVSRELHTLEEYRDRLIVFARTLASETVPARALAARTGLSHSTIVRMATQEAVADVGVEAGPVAANTLKDLDARQDPELYRRLQHAARLAAEGGER